MGVGKSTVCAEPLKKLIPGIYLDGDRCRGINPFDVSDENKERVLNNIGFLLCSFLQNSGYEYIIFGWVIPEEDIYEKIRKRLPGGGFEIHNAFNASCASGRIRILPPESVRRILRSGAGTAFPAAPV